MSALDDTQEIIADLEELLNASDTLVRNNAAILRRLAEDHGEDDRRVIDRRTVNRLHTHTKGDRRVMDRRLVDRLLNATNDEG